MFILTNLYWIIVTIRFVINQLKLKECYEFTFLKNFGETVLVEEGSERPNKERKTPSERPMKG